MSRRKKKKAENLLMIEEVNRVRTEYRYTAQELNDAIEAGQKRAYCKAAHQLATVIGRHGLNVPSDVLLNLSADFLELGGVPKEEVPRP